MSSSGRKVGRKSSIDEAFKPKCRLLAGGDRFGEVDFFAPLPPEWAKA